MKKRGLISLIFVSLMFIVLANLLGVVSANCDEFQATPEGDDFTRVAADGKSLSCVDTTPHIYHRMIRYKVGISGVLDYAIHPTRYRIIGCDGDNSCWACAVGYANFKPWVSTDNSNQNIKCEPVQFDNDGDGSYVPDSRFVKPVSYTSYSRTRDWSNVYPSSNPPYDCNDNDASIKPGATEVCGDGKDNDCDGTIDENCIAPNICSSPTQIIMKLEKPVEALGKLWSGDYIWDICYNNIFGVDGDGNHNCQAGNGNSVVWLSGATGTLASTTQDATYNLPVCYGDLTCRSVDESLAQYCAADEKSVLALYSDTNSHLSDPNYKPSGIVSLWKLDDNLIDDAGTNDNGVFNGGTANYVNGKINKALSFDGVNDYVSIPDDASLKAKVRMSVEAWVKRDAIGTGESDDIIAKRGDNNAGWGFFVDNDNKLNFTFFGVAGVISTATITDTNWHHVAATVDASGNVNIYIDGANVGTGNIAPASIRTTSKPLRIGVYVDESGNILTYHDFILDDLAIYNVALTAEEIQNRYNLGVYEKKICCKTAAGDKYWENMQGARITTADKKDSVKMTIEGLTAGANIDYEIRRNVLSNDDIAKSGSFVAQGNKDYVIWVAGYDNVDEDVFKDGTYHFRIKINGGDWITTKGMSGGELAVSATEQNTPPKAVILTPQMDVTEKKIGETISFTQASYDPDDELQVTWDFGDGAPTVTKSNCQTQNCDTTHPYDTQNTYVISLTAKEINRLQKDIDHTRIFVYQDGINPFPVITKPAPGEIIGGTGIIEFDASGSFVAKCAENICPPDKPAEQTCYSVDSLKCYYLHPKGGPKGTGYQLWFNWTFSEGDEKYGNWDNYGTTPISETGVVKFIRPFFQPITHYAKLKLGYQAPL